VQSGSRHCCSPCSSPCCPHRRGATRPNSSPPKAPRTRLATYQGTPVADHLDADTLKKVAADTMVGGATLTGLLGTSAWYAPGAAGAALVEAIVRDEKKLFPCCVSLEGEYGQHDICLGVPVVIGKNGWEKIVDYKLNEEEQAAFNKSADAVRSMNAVLASLGV